MRRTPLLAVLLLLVAVPVLALNLLTYRVPDGISPPAVGARVVVPLGSRLVTGIVVDAAPPLDVDWATRQYAAVRRRWSQFGFGPTIGA